MGSRAVEMRMKFPKMTPKRWFWSAMAVGAVWAFAGWRWDAHQVSWMAATQNGLSQPVETAAIPASFVLTSAQISAQNGMRSLAAGASGSGGGTSAETNARIVALEDENAQLKGLLQEFMRREQAWGYLHMYHIEPDDVLATTVVGYQAGPGPSILRLDKGKSSNVQKDAVVLAPLEQVHLLGRVVSVGQVECEARLISDASMGTQCQIIRQVILPGSPSPAQNMEVTGELCWLEGLGNGTMRITNIDKDSAQPQKGDLVCLTDGRWPSKVQHMVLGQVDSVGTNEKNSLRYDIRVVPRIAVSAQRTVMILVRE